MTRTTCVPSFPGAPSVGKPVGVSRPLQGRCGMAASLESYKKAVIWGGVSLAGLLFAAGPAMAQPSPGLFWQCVPADATHPQPGYCPVSNKYPFPIGSVAGTAPVVTSAAAENNHVLKATPGTIYSVYATNLTATAGFLVVLDAVSAPSDGAIVPLDCVPLPASGAASISWQTDPLKTYSTGITVVLTSASTCFTKTTGTITGFISGEVQ